MCVDALGLFGRLGTLLRPDHHIGQYAEARRKDENRQRRHAGDQGKAQQHARKDNKDIGLRTKLLGKVAPEVVFRGGAGDDDARRRGDQQRGNLAAQAVAHGGDQIGVDHLVRGHARVAGQADDQTAHDVDQRNENAHNGIALDELAGAVHCAVEVGLFLDFRAALLGALLVDEARVQVRVDGHLLARHGVEGEARRNLCHALCALGDDHKLHDDDDNEGDKTHHQVIADDELRKGADDVSRVSAVAEDERGGGNVQREPV